jgi:hypothetical protein
MEGVLGYDKFNARVVIRKRPPGERKSPIRLGLTITSR